MTRTSPLWKNVERTVELYESGLSIKAVSRQMALELNSICNEMTVRTVLAERGVLRLKENAPKQVDKFKTPLAQTYRK